MIDAERSSRIDQFCAAMKDKLSQPRNVAKSDWRATHPMDLYWMLHGEAGELLHAFRHEDCVAVAGEAIDVADFAFMIWDQNAP
jgi:hypothetical protein